MYSYTKELIDGEKKYLNRTEKHQEPKIAIEESDSQARGLCYVKYHRALGDGMKNELGVISCSGS